MASVETEGGRCRTRGSERPAACLQCEPAPRPHSDGSSKSGGQGRCTGARRLHRELGHHEHSPSASSFRACAASCPVRERPFHVRPLDQLNKLRCCPHPSSPEPAMPPFDTPPGHGHCCPGLSRSGAQPPPHHRTDTRALGPSSTSSRCRCICPHNGPGHPTHLLSGSSSSSNKMKPTIRSRGCGCKLMSTEMSQREQACSTQLRLQGRE